MSCSNNNNNNNESLTCASTSVLPTSSVLLPVTTSTDISQHNTTLKTLTAQSTVPATTQISKTVNQLIITTTSGQKIVSQTIPTQKVVSVIPATISGASSSTIGSSSSNTNGQNSGNNSTTTSTTDVTYPIQHYQNFNDGAIYSNTFYNQQNNQTPSSFPSTTTLAPSEQQPTAVYYMYPEGSIELDPGYDIEGHVSHTAQASPVTVQWLVDNFEPAEGCSLRRASLYNFYNLHCQEQKIEPVNAASFGKLIRSVFLGLRTRRLGTRGNSKYHYYGIRVKASSPLNQIPEDHAVSSRNHSINPPKRLKTSMYPDHEYKTASVTTIASNDHNIAAWTPTNSHGAPVLQNNTNVLNDATTTNGNTNGLTTITVTTAGQPAIASTSQTSVTTTLTTETVNQASILNNQEVNETDPKEEEYIQVINALPNLGNIDLINIMLPDNCNLDDVKKFEELYKNHCHKILDLVIGLKLGGVDEVWQKFWRSPNVDSSDYEQILSSDKFFSLCTVNSVIEFVKTCDFIFYQFCIDTIIPDVLRPIPQSFTHQIRCFGKSLVNWLRNALVNIPGDMQQVKLKIMHTFATTLRRYTTLNHLVAAARQQTLNHEVLDHMLHDLNRVDFRIIQQQATWVCGCDDDSFYRFEREFKRNLQNRCTLEEWAQWLEETITICLKKYEGTEKYAKMAHQFLLKYSYYSSTIIRDLTLRSANSFGGFHLMRLLHDEFTYYIVEHKIAQVANQTPIAIMTDLNLVHGQNFDD